MSLSLGSADGYRLTAQLQRSTIPKDRTALATAALSIRLCSSAIARVGQSAPLANAASFRPSFRSAHTLYLSSNPRRVVRSAAAARLCGTPERRPQFRGPFPLLGSWTHISGVGRHFSAPAEDDLSSLGCRSTRASSNSNKNSNNNNNNNRGAASPCYDAYWPPLPTVLGPIPVQPASDNNGVTANSDSAPQQLQQQQQPLVPPVVTRWPPPTTTTTTSDNSSAATAVTAAGAANGTAANRSTTANMASAAATAADVGTDPFKMDLREVAAAAAAAAAAANGGDAAAAAAAAAAVASADGKAAPAVDVTRHNFEVMLPVVRHYLSACDFFSFDCEMTGLFLEGQTENYLDDMQDRYNRTAAAAQSFVITQFGLSCMKRQEEQGQGGEPRYMAATFNFYLFPRPQEGAAFGTSRRFVCDAGSLAFLASQGFDFNRCIYDGVPFMPVRQRDELLRQLDRDNGGGAAGGEGGRADVALTKPEDQAFVQGLLATVHEWLASDSPEPLDLPTVNRYLRLLTYQALARPENFGGPPGGAPGWHPGFFLKKVTDERSGWTRVRLLRCATAAEAAAAAAAEAAERRAALAAAAGFAAVWEAMRDCGRPGVGHNCMFDVAYGISQFGEGRLPATWEGFKRATANWFRGGLYDTKHICRQLPEVLGSETTLAVMYGSLLPQPAGASAAATAAVPGVASGQLPARLRVCHARGFEKYVAVAAGQCAHEAGYDAFMTGSVFAALEAILAAAAAAAKPEQMEAGGGDVAMKDTSAAAAPYASVVPYMWRLNVTRSDLPYALLRPTVPDDPTSREPVPERPLVFHLGPLSYGVRAGDIHRACEEAGLGKVRITFLPGNNALIEVESEEAAARLRGEGEAGGVLAGRGLCAEILPYAQYRARKDEMLAAGTWPLPGYGGGGGGGGPRGGGGGARPATPNGGGAAAAAAAASPAGGATPRPAKRPRVEVEAEEEQQQQQQAPPTLGRQCVVM